MVHTLWDRFLANLPDGHELRVGITASSTRCRFRAVLQSFGVVDYMQYGTHDLRRGRAEELSPCTPSLSIPLPLGLL